MAPSTSDLAIQAARDGDLCLLKQISRELDLRRVKGFKGRSLLHFAAGGGHLEVCKFLVEDLGFHVNSTSAKGETPILLAVTAEALGGGNLPVMRYLLDCGGDPAMPDARGPNVRGITPLHIAAGSGNCEAVRLLLSKGVPVDPLDYRGTPLILAAAMGQDKVVKILLDHGADPNKVIHDEISPRTMACSACSLKRVKLLTQAGADVNSKSLHDAPVLMIAVDKGSTDIVKFLLEVGADPNIPDKAMSKIPHDATLFANRSLCWLRLREGERALSDAQHCKTLHPQWAKAWYREGMALSFLKEHKGAVDAFEEALNLDATNHDIKKALRDAIESMKNAACPREQNPQVDAYVRSD